MSRPAEAAYLLKENLSPRQIAEQMGIGVKSVTEYLYREVGKGTIRRSDIVFAFPEEMRDRIEVIINSRESACLDVVARAAEDTGTDIHRDDLAAYLALRDARVVLGDMYEIVRDVELSLHDGIRRILKLECGDEWWRDGVPVGIRADCAAKQEYDDNPADHAYCYTTLLDLKKILDKGWRLFSRHVPKGLDKKPVTAALEKLNPIRNAVMHPVRGDRLTEEDFVFVRGLASQLRLKEWPKAD